MLAKLTSFYRDAESVGSPDANDGELIPASGEHFKIGVSITAFLKLNGFVDIFVIFKGIHIFNLFPDIASYIASTQGYLNAEHQVESLSIV